MTKADKIGTIALAAFGAWVAYRFYQGYVVERRVDGVGKIKRRIYHEMQSLQHSNVPLNETWDRLTSEEQNAVERIARQYNYVQSASSKKSYGEAYYNSIRRQYAAISGTSLPCEESYVYNSNGDEIIRYRDYGTQEQQMQGAKNWIEESIRPGGGINDAMFATLLYIANGGKFIWSQTPGGVKQECFATSGSAEAERKARISYLASKNKGGKTVLAVAHQIFERYDIDDMVARDAVCQVLLSYQSVAEVNNEIYTMYVDAHQKQNPNDAPF